MGVLGIQCDIMEYNNDNNNNNNNNNAHTR